MKKIISIIIASVLFLSSCNTVRNSAGVNRKVVDEYQVIENPPLVIPPDFNLLPPEQMESKNLDNADGELAQEILFGLDNDNDSTSSQNSIINLIIEETEADKVGSNIRDEINQTFAGEKSSVNDETLFKNEEELNSAIKKTNENNSDVSSVEEKKKKRFFFFNKEAEKKDKKKKRFFFFSI